MRHISKPPRYPRHRDPDSWAAALGCLLTTFLVLAALAWWGFIIWAIYTVVKAVAAG